MTISCKQEIEFLTSFWKGPRLEDGRPMVSAEVLEKLRNFTLEECWGYIYHHGYKYQFQGDFMRTNPNPDFRLVGRAVTATLMPTRPDLHEIMTNQANSEGRRGTFNQMIIESLVEDDVLVVDFFDKVRDGTFVGGNLSTAIKTRTKRGGAVLWGGIRDMEQIIKIDDLQIMHRGEDPTAIAEYLMTGLNTACRIGGAVCLPGDVVYASQSGVLFIPSHLAEAVVISGEKSKIKDIFGFIRLRSGKYTNAQIDRSWTTEIMMDFLEWIKTAPEGKPYLYLTWDNELEIAKEADKTQHIGEVRI